MIMRSSADRPTPLFSIYQQHYFARWFLRWFSFIGRIFARRMGFFLRLHVLEHSFLNITVNVDHPSPPGHFSRHFEIQNAKRRGKYNTCTRTAHRSFVAEAECWGGRRGGRKDEGCKGRGAGSAGSTRTHKLAWFKFIRVWNNIWKATWDFHSQCG